ncbi:L-threonine 3-dehydrogenase [Maricaulis maris]|uniref:L-threonine 3-dehydrogenase n=1 Tax=Maricaulis maris TaxID=74318 RepID=A0A495DK55_9PROT|nr:L-threonine 3-dehydrogenase [Maricaulis maris]RKR02952.1 L-threonine 3-dehydrogenase [Maricaulis maris]
MKALVKAKPEEGIWMEDVPEPQIGPDDVLIKIKRTAICGTDIHIYNWDDWAAKNVPTPMVVGHEYAGEIVDTGSNVTRVKVGQRVSGEGHVVGVTSRAARAGRFHLDPETRGVGVNIPGAFAEYMKLPAFNVVPLSEDVPDEIGSILDPLGNAVHTALQFDMIGEDVLITGAGPIGIMAAAIARHVGARHVVLTDINTHRLHLASQVAPKIRTVDVSKEKIEDVAKELGMTEGFDVGLEMSGAPQAFGSMLNNMVMGGKVAMLGLPSRPIEVDFGQLVLKAITLKGIYGREMFETWYKMIAMLESGLDVSRIITHRYKADEFQKGFDAMRAGKSGKVVLDWD